MASHLWFHCFILRGMDATDKTTPRTGTQCRRPPADRLPCGGGAGVPLHAEQRRASRAERHRHLVHRAPVAGRDLRHGRGVLADTGVRVAVRRRRPRPCRRWWRRPMAPVVTRARRRRPGPPCGPRCFTAPLFVVLSLGGRMDIRALRHSPRNSAARPRILVSAHARRALGHSPVVAARLLQRHRPSHHHAVGDIERRRCQCPAESAVHVRLRNGHRRFRLGDRRRAADRGRRGGSIVSGKGNAAALPLPPHRAAASAGAAASIQIGISRWAC